jgi:RNA polymerase sigma-70 factor, ECF subfamily
MCSAIRSMREAGRSPAAKRESSESEGQRDVPKGSSMALGCEVLGFIPSYVYSGESESGSLANPMTLRSTVPSTGATCGTSPSLLVRVRASEPRAWERFIALYGPLVLHWCRRAGLQADDGEDIFQDVFQSVYSGIGAFEKRRTGDTLRGWLFTITRNKIRDHFRRARREPRGEGGTSARLRLGRVAAAAFSLERELPSEADAKTAFFRRALELIREDFQERTWSAFWCTAIEGRSTADVAAELGMSVGAVRVARSRVLGRLRREIGEGS